MNEFRIVSFLPSATEMVCALGLADDLVGITHECDYPPEIKTRPIVVRTALELGDLTLVEIDAVVSDRMCTGAGLYAVDEELLRRLAPTLILTQNLCQVCAPSGNEISRALQAMAPVPRILWFTPRSLSGIEENLRELGQATGRVKEAEALIAAGHARIEKVLALTRRAEHRPRVFCIEWLDPVYCSGHWVPEMVELAGGVDTLSRSGADSVRVEWQEVLDWAPEVLILNPCGFNAAAAAKQASQLFTRRGWKDVPAVRTNRVYAVDANSYFARPGPRIVDGIELLAHLIHPELCSWMGPKDAFRLIARPELGDISQHG